MLKFTTPLTVNFRPKQTGKHKFIYCRIRLNGVDATDFSTHIKHCDSWDQQTQLFNDKLKGFENQELIDICNAIKQLYRDNKDNVNFSAHDLKGLYIRKSERRTLIQAYDDHLKDFNKKLGKKGFSKGTLRAHTTRDRVMRDYLAHVKRQDIELIHIRESFAHSFIDYMYRIRRLKQNYLLRCLNHLKWILEVAKSQGYLIRNPLDNVIERKEDAGKPAFLTEEQLFKMKVCDLFTPAQVRVSHCFLFQCYTGLSYSDLKCFDAEKHIIQISGVSVIQMNRKKSGVEFTVPIFPYVRHLLQLYGNNIPVISGQKMNEHLKDIARVLGIKTRLTTHVGRKTAGTYLLNNKVRMEVVSKVLGHKSIRTTEKLYAFMLKDTIIRETAHLMGTAA